MSAELSVQLRPFQLSSSVCPHCPAATEIRTSEVKEVELVQVVEDDAKTGVPAVHDAVDIDVDPRPQRKWLK
ncbi:hypothetical protein HNP48_001492 [Acidovorax soli]|uniref:Uncharacterized protein n=1 Tax=Acidovorax soli TaxID=592050 RepID=A0A7X0PBE9_9BURK|nr:hypothetical protein [Acidovorax soli]MBB6558828.1 hypothetical protein [Acidovorax soli]